MTTNRNKKLYPVNTKILKFLIKTSGLTEQEFIEKYKQLNKAINNNYTKNIKHVRTIYRGESQYLSEFTSYLLGKLFYETRFNVQELLKTKEWCVDQYLIGKHEYPISIAEIETLVDNYYYSKLSLVQKIKTTLRKWLS
jgi:hypothetical protein